MNDIEFIRVKIGLFASAISEESQRDGFTQMWALPLEELSKKKELSKTQAIKFDRDIEWCVRSFFPPEEANEIRDRIRSKFGFDALGKKPETVVKRVLKRGRIATDAEAEIITGFVANQGNESAIGKLSFDRLAELLDKAGY